MLFLCYYRILAAHPIFYFRRSQDRVVRSTELNAPQSENAKKMFSFCRKPRKVFQVSEFSNFQFDQLPFYRLCPISR